MQPAYDITELLYCKTMVLFLVQCKLVEKVNVLVSAYCSWPTAAGFMFRQTSVSQLL